VTVMTFAYADPPYVGQAKKHYSKEDVCKEVNHEVLVGTLDMSYESWALSCSSPSLQAILQICPVGVRVMAWVKPFCIFKPNVNPAYAWEPVIVKGGNKFNRADLSPTVRDWVSANVTLKRGLPGVKPEGFWMWLFLVVNLKKEDTFIDMFPGSGAGAVAYKKWQGMLF